MTGAPGRRRRRDQLLPQEVELAEREELAAGLPELRRPVVAGAKRERAGEEARLAGVEAQHALLGLLAQLPKARERVPARAREPLEVGGLDQDVQPVIHGAVGTDQGERAPAAVRRPFRLLRRAGGRPPRRRRG